MSLQPPTAGGSVELVSLPCWIHALGTFRTKVFPIQQNVLLYPSLFLLNNNICSLFVVLRAVRLECVVVCEVEGHREFQCNTDVEECAVCQQDC